MSPREAEGEIDRRAGEDAGREREIQDRRDGRVGHDSEGEGAGLVPSRPAAMRAWARAAGIPAASKQH